MKDEVQNKSKELKFNQLIEELIFLSHRKDLPNKEKSIHTKIISKEINSLNFTRSDGLPKKLIGFYSYKELPFELLYSKYSEHKRLSIFAKNGLKCVDCNNTANRLIMTVDQTGGIHVDLFTNDLIHMNVDHIIPLSKNGKDIFENKQPMCCICNLKKGNKIIMK